MKKTKLFITVLILILLVMTGCGSGPQENTPGSIIVTFKDYDDSILYHDKVPYGSTVSYNGPVPQREISADKIYTFSGWDKSLDTPLYENTVFNANYIEELRKYVVTFNNFDGTLIERVNVNYGTTAKYTSPTPVKLSDDEHLEYAFSGWDKDIDSYRITSDVTFTAQFTPVEYVYATFNNYDGTQLKRSKIVKGENAIYSDSTPTRSYSGNDKVYKFTGWDKPLSNLNKDTTFTALFDLLNLYTVTFKNYDGTILQVSKVVHGEDAIYVGNAPYRAQTTSGNYKYTYTFNGWSPSIKNVTSDLTVIAQFTSTKTSDVSGDTAIKNHLDIYGSDSFHNVITSYQADGISTLGYSGSMFYMGYTHNQSLKSTMAITYSYGSSSGIGSFEVYDSGVLMFSAYYTIHFADHAFSNIYCTDLITNRYTTEDQLTLVTALAVLAAKFAVNGANDYCNNHGLPYLF